jgi:hypothetical protein
MPALRPSTASPAERRFGTGLPIVVHPQIPSVCQTDRYAAWPLEGINGPYPFGMRREGEVLWPVPRIVDARIVDCSGCGKTGIQPKNWKALVRYIPGARLDPERPGAILFPDLMASIAYPTGDGEDEEAEPWARDWLFPPT